MTLNLNKGDVEMNNISFKRIWQDIDFFEIELSACSDTVSASTKVYVTDDAIIELSKNLLSNIENKNFDFLWENGEKGNNSTPYVSLRFFNKDKLGHVFIEVYMEIDDDGPLDKHNCCFYIKTELGILNNFAKKIININSKDIDIKVQLID